MVEQIYWADAYMKEFSATVTGIWGSGILLDRTAFYPTGGGQPNDTGTIKIGEAEYEVQDVRKDGDEILHFVESTEGIAAGTRANCAIDWGRRYAHMRYHTALHIIDGIIMKRHEGIITGGQIYENRARMDFDVPNMDKDMMDSIISEAQAVVDAGKAVIPKFIDKAEALRIQDLSRTKPGNDILAKLDKVRVIDIEGFDMQLDGGTHVANTIEVGKILLDKYENKGQRNKRVSIKLT